MEAVVEAVAVLVSVLVVILSSTGSETAVGAERTATDMMREVGEDK